MLLNICSKNWNMLILKSKYPRILANASRGLMVRPKNYYEMLGLKQNCTQKEIREAFLLLSKKYHPDTATANNVDPRNMEFVALLEAYQVLSKAHSRANYDLSLKGVNTVHFVSNDTVYEPWKINSDDYAEKGPNYSSYYGIKNLKKLPNWYIVMACIIFAGIGVTIQAIAIRHSITFKREQLDRTSAESSSIHEQVRLDAIKYGNAEQLERLKLRLRKSE